MAEAKHTPGPWEVRGSVETVDFGIIVRDERARDGWAVIAEAFSEIHYAGERAPEALANARLIAAAPKMLQALHEFEDAFVEFDPENSASRLRMRLALISARDAMAAATGAAA